MKLSTKISMVATVAGIAFANVAYAETNCHESLARVAQHALKSETFTTAVDFKTNDIATLGGQTVVLGNGVVFTGGGVTHILIVESPDGSTAIIKGRFFVSENKIVYKEFCELIGETEIGL